MRILIKMTGALCIMTSSILTGIGLERRMRKRWQLFLETQETLTFLEKEMTYHRAPINEAFRFAAKRCKTELGTVLLETAERIEQRSGRAFGDIWKETLKKHFPPDLLLREELHLFEEASMALCNTDTITQRTLLEKYVDRFQMMSETEAQVFREKGGLYRRLAAAAGIFLVILFI